MQRSRHIRFPCEVAFELSPDKKELVTFTVLFYSFTVLFPLPILLPKEFLSSGDFSLQAGSEDHIRNAVRYETTVLQFGHGE